MSEPAPDGAQPLKISAAFQLDPVWVHDQPGTGFTGNLELFARQLGAYLVTQLERFGDPRGADLLLMVYVQRGDEGAGTQYRSGHYEHEEPEAPAGAPAAPDA